MTYVPSEKTLKFMIWRKRYLPGHDNVTPITHYKMIDYYFDTLPDDIKMVECHRGIGKSQLGMEFSLYCVCEGIEEYILFVGGTQDLTNDLIASAALLLEDTSIPGVSVKRSVEGVLEVNTHGNVGYLVSKSTGSRLRGVAKGKRRVRPSLIVLDDIVDDQLILNSLRMARANRWLTSALLPTLSPGGKTIGSGTPMHKADPFMTLVESFGSYKIPLSKTSFPDRFTPSYIKRKKSQYEKLGQLRDWKREFELVLTDAETQLFDMSKVGFITEDKLPGNLTWYMACDLAISHKSGSDYSAFVCVGIDKHGTWYVVPYMGQYKPSQSASKIMELQNRYEILNIGVEQGATYLAMIEHLDTLMQEYQNYFYINELKHGGIEKHSRIKALEPVINSGRIVIVDNGLAAEMLVEQLELTDNESCSAKHDDCFSGDTLVVVNGEEMRFDKIPKEGVIRGFNGKDVAYVNGGVRHRRSNLFSIKLNDGRIIKSTANHEFLTVENGVYKWIKTIDLKGHTLCEAKHLTTENTVLEATDTITRQAGTESREPTCIEMYGNTITERYKRGSLSTTKTTIEPTTTYPILNLWKLKNTVLCMLKSGIGTIKNKLENILPVLGISPRSGTVVQKVSNGIDNMQPGKSDQNILSPVNVAEKSIWEPEHQNQIDIAQTSAHQKREEIAELMTLTKSVSNVGVHLETINTELKLPVAVSVGLIEEKSLTYCVEVPDDRCFSLANGIVVSNCIDAMAYLVRMVPRYVEPLPYEGDVYTDEDLPFELR